MTRLILDTCAVIELITSSDETDVEFWDIFDNPDTHAITERLTLLSSDQKFAFYRNQGLDLIEY